MYSQVASDGAFMCSYLQSNGYKPTPLDLTSVLLNEKMKELVEQLAENTHRVWSSVRIGQGWTYGLNDVSTQAGLDVRPE